MTVAMVHHLTAPAGELRAKWSGQFRPADFGVPDETGSGSQQAFGPALPGGVRGVWLAIGEGSSTGVTLFDDYREARRDEPAMRAFWSGLTGRPVADGAVAGVWRPQLGTEEPARMIWSSPAPEPAGEPDDDPDPKP